MDARCKHPDRPVDCPAYKADGGCDTNLMGIGECVHQIWRCGFCHLYHGGLPIDRGKHYPQE